MLLYNIGKVQFFVPVIIAEGFTNITQL